MPTLKFDFHLHTLDDPYDRHVYHTATELIDKAASLGYGALAITLHGVQLASRSAQEYAASRGILLLQGVEQNIETFHVLLINYPKDVADGIRTFADLEKAKSPDGLVIAAHPYFPGATCLGDKLIEHAHLFDAVEVSGYYHRLWDPNRKGRAAAGKLGLPMVGNSDTHTLDQFGCTWSEVEVEPGRESDPAGLVKAIKQGKARVQGRSLGIWKMAKITWKVVVMGYMPWIDYKKSRGYQPAP